MQVEFYQDEFKVLQVRGPILYFFLLVLGIPLDFDPDASHKQGGFSKTLLEKSLEFVPNKKDSIVAFNLSFVLLPAEINPVLEEQRRKKDAFVASGPGCIKMILKLLTEVITIYMQALIVKVGILSFERIIAECGTCLELAMVLAFDK